MTIMLLLIAMVVTVIVLGIPKLGGGSEQCYLIWYDEKKGRIVLWIKTPHSSTHAARELLGHHPVRPVYLGKQNAGVRIESQAKDISDE